MAVIARSDLDLPLRSMWSVVDSSFNSLRFAVEPTDTAMTPGTPGRLDCSVTSSSDVTAPEIQWLKDDSLISSDSRRLLHSF